MNKIKLMKENIVDFFRKILKLPPIWRESDEKDIDEYIKKLFPYYNEEKYKELESDDNKIYKRGINNGRNNR